MVSLALAPDNWTLLSARHDSEQAGTYDCSSALQGHFSAVTSLALAPDNWTLLSGSRDKTVHLWDLRTHAKTATIPIHEAVEGER